MFVSESTVDLREVSSARISCDDTDLQCTGRNQPICKSRAIIETDEPTDWQEERRKVGAFLRENVPGCLVLAVLFAAMVGFGVGLGFL